MSHIIIPDTTILWQKEKSVVVNDEFLKLWGSNASKLGLELIVPEVVKGELIFQQFNSAIKSFHKAKDSLKELNSVTNSDTTLAINANKIRIDVEKRFDDWLKTLNGKIEKTPLDKINWSLIQSRSIWHELPFKKENGKKSNEEKERGRDDDGGFRDLLIAETAFEFAKREKSSQISFITSDQTQYDYVKERCIALNNFSIHNSLDEFISHINLIHENIAKESADQILDLVKHEFFRTTDTSSSFFLESGIPEIINKKYSEYLTLPIEITGISNLLDPMPNWIPNPNYKWVVGSTSFVKKEEEKYQWRSIVKYRRQFESKAYSLLTNNVVTSIKILTSQFEVFWTTDVGRDNKINSSTLDEIKFLDQKFVDGLPIEDD